MLHIPNPAQALVRAITGRIFSAFVLLVACVALAGSIVFLGLDVAAHHVASRMRAPHLQSLPQPAPDLIYRTLDGRQQHLLPTNRQVVFLDLWGTWCIQCVAEMPTVQKLYDHYRNDPQVKFLIVSRLDSPARVRLYARHNHFDLPFFVTHDDEIPASMQLGQFPETFILSKNGDLVAHHLGAADWSDPSVTTFIDHLKTQQ
jgi:thiol-disulfide isomerase/thioredoxin